MRLIDADRLLDRCKFYHLPNGDLAVPIIDVQHAPTVEAPDINVGSIDTTTHDSIPAETGKNDGVGTSGDCISRQQATCEYCHEDSDGYVLSIEKNGHAYIQNGKLALRANGWWGECNIEYCPMCGRKLRGDKHETD